MQETVTAKTFFKDVITLFNLWNIVNYYKKWQRSAIRYHGFRHKNKIKHFLVVYLRRNIEL